MSSNELTRSVLLGLSEAAPHFRWTVEMRSPLPINRRQRREMAAHRHQMVAGRERDCGSESARQFGPLFTSLASVREIGAARLIGKIAEECA